jgi:hypothetical protein
MWLLLFDAMSPGEGGGKRQSVDVYEVSIDQAARRLAARRSRLGLVGARG